VSEVDETTEIETPEPPAEEPTPEPETTSDAPGD
jgi:hypothetical protein